MSYPRDVTSHQDWPDHLTVTRNSGVDFYYEQYRRLREREESLLKERDALRRENVALRSRLQAPTNTIVVPAIQNRAQQQPSKIAESPAAHAAAHDLNDQRRSSPTRLPTALDAVTLRAVRE